MSPQKKDKKSTKERLLESAAHIFAEKSFAEATIKDICRRAQANVASVNYYFNSKEELYREAWKNSFMKAIKKYPLSEGVSPGDPPEKRLKVWIRSLVYKLADESNQAFLITQKEMASPTPLLREVMKECVGPLRKDLMAIVRELVGEEAKEKEIHFCVASILGQCLGIIRQLRMVQHRGEDFKDYPLVREIKEDLDTFVEHVYRFSLGGIKASKIETSQGN